MNATAIRNLIYSRLWFFVSVAVCLAISQGAITSNVGISYYGVTRSTVVWYVIGLLGAGWFVVRATRAMNTVRPDVRRLALALNVLVVLLCGVVLTPYTVTP